MRKINMPRGEKGFWSAVFVLMLTALAALAFSTYTTIRTEGTNDANQAQMLRADYAATAGAYMGLALYQDTTSFGQKTLTISGSTVSLSVAPVQVSDGYGGFNTISRITSSASLNNSKSSIQIDVDPGRDLSQMAIYTKGNVSSVTPQDSTNATDWSRMKAHADSVPTIRTNDLLALSNSQTWGGLIHTRFGNWTAPDNWCGSFWNSPGIPNVTYVFGNMTINGNNHVHGIYVVTGSVTVNGNCHIDGVVYLPNVTSTLIHGAGSQDDSIEGGIVSYGDISGTGNHVNVRHKYSYMKAFCAYQQFPTTIRQMVVSWRSVASS